MKDLAFAERHWHRRLFVFSTALWKVLMGLAFCDEYEDDMKTSANIQCEIANKGENC
jgi:hypothetical protein